MNARSRRVRSGAHARGALVAAVRSLALTAVLYAGLSVVAGAQRPAGNSPPPTPPPRIPLAAPSRADSMLAVGRLAAAEEALYTAVSERPRSPAPRGALGRYLASRARFRIAEILYQEALRFGAERGTVLRAIAAMAPYRASLAESGAPIRVPFRPSEDGRTLGWFAARTASGEMTAVLDPQVTGVVARTAVREYWIGARRFTPGRATEDPSVPATEIRIGLDQLWALHPAVDERAGVLTLDVAPGIADGEAVTRIPFVLTFPGLDLVPRPGRAPLGIAGRGGRALLRGTRWSVNAAEGTVDVRR